ncbi:MAG: glycosyltransferase family 2 protein [Candidatus Omnitrophica bacterium]|nr:glycosyltransferase family 2 protein [Candidatus Omnitrophota bacterium]
MEKASINKRISVIVVTAGLSEYIKLCLDSINEQSIKPQEIIVVDNSLNDNFSQNIKKNYPNIKLYKSRQNLYYAQALNIGIEISSGDFILCLNDDVILESDFIKHAQKGFSIDNGIGMVSGKILRLDKKTIDTTGLFLSIFRTAQERGYGLKDKGQFDKEGYIFGVNGAVAFYRRKMLEEIKINSDYFDSDYNIFYEDLDIAWRAQNFGWKGYYIPTAIAYHARGKTVRADVREGRKFARFYISDELNFDLIKNRYLTIIKNETLWGFLLHLPFIFIYDIFVLGYIFLFRQKVLKIFFLKNLAIKSAFSKRQRIYQTINYIKKRRTSYPDEVTGVVEGL